MVVLVSGSGTNLQALLDRLNFVPGAPARVVRVLASRPGIGALERAERAGVPTAVLPRAAFGEREGPGSSLCRALLGELELARAGLVVLAGFLLRVPGPVVRAYRGRIINIHPALLPGFGGPGMYGRRVHAAVLDAGARVTGVTVHFVDEEYDRGPIIAQWPVPVWEDDDEESLAARVLEVEHRLLPEVVVAFARGEVRLGDGGCRWERPWFAGSRFAFEGVGEGHPSPCGSATSEG